MTTHVSFVDSKLLRGVSDDWRQIRDRSVSWALNSTCQEQIHNRLQACAVILEFFDTAHFGVLDLSGLNLDSLPQIFHFEPFVTQLQELNLSKNAFTVLPDSLCSLRNLENLFLADNFYLQALPQDIGRLALLKELDLSQDRTSETMEEVLDVLQTIIFPESFKNLQRLEKLVIAGYELIEIPTVIFECKNLQILEILNTNLSVFPVELCDMPNLIHLDLSSNIIDKIPEEINKLTRLKILCLSDSWIETLPESIFTLNEECDVYLTETCLTRAQLQIIKQDRVSSPKFFYDEPKNDFSLKEIEDSLGEIYAFVALSDSLDIEDLISNEESIENLQMWIERLEEAVPLDCKNNVPFYKVVIATLQMAIEDVEYREIFNAVLKDASTTCGDRVILSILHLGLEKQLRGLCQKDLSEAIEFLKRGVFATGILEKIASNKIKILEKELKEKLCMEGLSDRDVIEEIERHIDPVEIYLAFPVGLKESLKLPLDVEHMLYFRTSRVDQRDLDEAKEEVLKQIEDEEIFAEFLIKNDAWKNYLDRHYSHQMKAFKMECLLGKDYSKSAAVYEQRVKRWTQTLIQIAKEQDLQQPIAKRTRLAKFLNE